MTGAVYFAKGKASGLIKIGYSANVRTRLSAIKGAVELVELLAFYEGGREAEKAEHVRFAAFRVRGEWFEPSPPLLAHIASIGLPPLPSGVLNPDKYTVLARQWAAFLEERTAKAQRVQLHIARRHVAAALGLKAGKFENLRNSRIAAINVDDFETLRAGMIAALKADLDAVVNAFPTPTLGDIASIRRALGLPATGGGA